MNIEKYHTFWSRFLALIIDGILLKPLEIIDTYILNGTIESLGIMAWGIFYSIIGILYYVLMHYKYGQTVGKMIVRIKVIDVSEERLLSLYQACLRNILSILLLPFSIYIYYILAFSGKDMPSIIADNPWMSYMTFIILAWVLLEFITMLFNEKRRAIHDLIAGSVVIKLNKNEEINSNSQED